MIEFEPGDLVISAPTTNSLGFDAPSTNSIGLSTPWGPCQGIIIYPIP